MGCSGLPKTVILPGIPPANYPQGLGHPSVFQTWVRVSCNDAVRELARSIIFLAWSDGTVDD